MSHLFVGSAPCAERISFDIPPLGWPNFMYKYVRKNKKCSFNNNSCFIFPAFQNTFLLKAQCCKILVRTGNLGVFFRKLLIILVLWDKLNKHIYNISKFCVT